MKLLSENLKNNNLKVTPQRLAIYGYVYNSKEHPNAETIYKSIKNSYPSMSLATVYKNLISLRDSNLVQEINVGENSFRYDANTHFHSHIICTNCRKVIDYEKTPNIEEIKDELINSNEYLIFSQQLYFYGLCPKCK